MVVMKRFFIFLILLIVLCATIFFIPKDKTLSCFDIKIYTCEIEKVEGCSYILNGNGMIIDVKNEDVEKVLQNLKTFSSITFKTHQNVFEILSILKIKQLQKDCAGENIGSNYYGYIDSINNYVNINGEKVNVQIYENYGVCTIGIPMIFGSY